MTLKECKDYHLTILEQTLVWDKMSPEEQAYFESSKSAFQFESRTAMFIKLHL